MVIKDRNAPKPSGVGPKGNRPPAKPKPKPKPKPTAPSPRSSGSSAGRAPANTRPKPKPKQNKAPKKKKKPQRGVASGTYTGGVNYPTTGIGAVRNMDQLLAAARAQIDTEIKGEVAPYESDLASTQKDETTALANTDKLFSTIMPYVQQGAQAVTTGFNEAQQTQGNIFSAAEDRLSQLRAQQANEGAQLAAQVGGPVDPTEFTSPVDISQQAFNYQVAGDQLNALADAQAGAQEANAFATQVMPLVQKEETAQTRQQFDKEITSLRRQIADIRSTKSSRVNSRLNDLLVQEREYMMQRVQAERDWQVALSSLKNENQRIALERAQLFGVDAKGNLTLDAQNLLAQTSKADQATNADLMLKAGQALEMMRHPPVQSIQRTVTDPTTGELKTVTEPFQAPPITDATKLYWGLLTQGFPQQIALKIIRRYTKNPKWRPKSGAAYTSDQFSQYQQQTNPMFTGGQGNDSLMGY